MTAKIHYRNYVNPGRGTFTAAWQRAYLPNGDFYTEDKTGKIIDALIMAVRPGVVIRVRRVFCLAPWKGTPKKRRAILAERFATIIKRGGVIEEAETALESTQSCAKMLLGGYEDIASSGRGLGKGKTGRPKVFDLTEREDLIAQGLWNNKRFKNDPERLDAIEAKIGKRMGRTTARNRWGAPGSEGPGK